MALGEKRLFLLDMDGTLYLGNTLFDGVREFFSAVKAHGGRCLFLTNNSSRGVQAYQEKMARLGIPTAPEDYITSVDAAIYYLKKNRPDAYIYVGGTHSFYEQLESAGLRVTEEPDENVDTLLSAFDTELTFQKLENASRLLTRGVDWVATNPDWVCPTEWGSVPDCGSICRMLTTATGRTPYFVGKPRPEMVFLALEQTGFSAQESVMVGDRIYTDIASGVNAGIDSVFVLSGEGVTADTEKYKIYPTWTYSNIKALWRDWEASL